MNHLLTYISMNGYATYVWSAYGIGVGVLLINWLTARSKQKRTINHLRRLAGSKRL
jgi:heme exporter protein CcmD